MTNSFGLSDKIYDAEANCLSCGAPLPAERQGQQKFTGGKNLILVLGMDNEQTKKLYENVKKAVSLIGKEMQISVLKDEEQIARYNLKKLPALIVNGSIVSQGIISDPDDILADIEFLI